MLDTTVISPSLGLLDIKIYEDGLVHHFTIKTTGTIYEITRTRGELVAYANAESEVNWGEGRISSILIRTDTYVFEVVSAPSYSYHSHKRLRKTTKPAT
jgi:hypothetical protein